MGPRLISRGNLGVKPWIGKNSLGFNGATAYQPWKFDCLTFATQTIRDSFNGATAYQPWKWGDKSRDQMAADRASMGPRLISRGNFI